MRVPFWKRALSYLTPVTLWKGSSPVSPVLELLLYQGRYQLASLDALYSDGNRYRPVVTGLRAIKSRLPGIDSVLVLGAGLGSTVDVLRRFSARPRVKLVELDSVAAHWAQELLRAEDRKRVHIVVDDAQSFIARDVAFYDLLVIDVFIGRAAAPFVTQPEFLTACKKRIAKGGGLLLNYMQNPNSPSWEETFSRIETVFTGARVLAFGPNRVVVWEDGGSNV
jgi:spermidine synthase